jgi:hypothetical protein
MNIIRTKLDDKEFNSALHELASEGSRISVEVEHMKMVQIELDSRGWSSKAKKWLPVINNIPVAGLLGRSSQDSAVAETEKICDHLNKCNAFCDRLQGITCISVEERSMWTLDGEHELQELVDLADGWLEKHQAFLDIDGRKNEI